MPRRRPSCRMGPTYALSERGAPEYLSGFAGPCAGCDDPRVVEYGGAINNGPAGQVAGSGGGGAPDLGQPVDFLGNVSHTFNDAANFVLSQPPEVLVIAIVVFFLGLIVLRRAF